MQSPKHGEATNGSPGSELQLLEMEEDIIQHISTFMPSTQWARGPALACRSLNTLSLPVIKVRLRKTTWRHMTRDQPEAWLQELFTWIGNRLQATKHLAIHIDCRVWGGSSESLLMHLLRSGHKLNANMETLDLTIEGWHPNNPNESLLGPLQALVTSSCHKLNTISLFLDRYPLHFPNCIFLRHICLYVLPPCQWWEGDPVVELPGLNSRNLPSLRSVFLQGNDAPVHLTCLDFSDSNSLEVVRVHDCSTADHILPPSCEIHFLGRSSPFIRMLKEQKHQPLVKRAKHVWFQNDMPEWLAEDAKEYYSDMGSSDMDSSSDEDKFEDERLRNSAISILDFFPSMCSLRLTRSDGWSLPSLSEIQEWGVKPLRCLSGHWQHENLKELEGLGLWITIPMLPKLTTLLVYCHGKVALEFANPESIGRTITRMSITGKPIAFHMQQQEKLCMTLKGRNLQLVGDSNMCVTLHASNDSIPPDAELLRRAKQDLKCRCKACPYCLGVGKGKLEEEDPMTWPFG